MIEIHNLEKKYDGDVLFKDVNITFLKSDISFLVGKNGVGKTTLMTILAGLLDFEQGDIEIDGRLLELPYQQSIRKQIFLLPTDNISIDYLTATENLSYYAKLYHIDVNTVVIDEILKEYQLKQEEKKLVVEYSTGMKKRLDLAILELISPEILLLDEPSLGLDVYHVDFLKRKLMDYKKQNKTIIVTSHDMSLANKVSDKVFLFKDKNIEVYNSVDVDLEAIILQSYQDVRGGEK
ncbi:MAG: ABC transporter ATP-binding protein [Streptococcaceae bacterium]|jgi:ABC-type multidrug transport system ATPase subunit|nr:ABC transporter ATP-binding protein [Streptococcaceae bacterium]